MAKPLQAALTLSRRLAQGQLDADVDQLLDDAGKKADWLQGLLEEFLAHAFLRQEGDAKPCICDIREDVVTPVLDELWDDLQKHGVALENHLDFLPSHLGIVKGDKVALRSVLRNLINNAIHYGGKGCSLKIDYDRSEPFFRLQVFNSGPVPPKKPGPPCPQACRRERATGMGAPGALGSVSAYPGKSSGVTAAISGMNPSPEAPKFRSFSH